MGVGPDLLDDRIVCDEGILGGKPVVRGTRISVEIVLGALAVDPNLDELFINYPRLTMADVQACLAYGRNSVRNAFLRQRAASRRKKAAVSS